MKQTETCDSPHASKQSASIKGPVHSWVYLQIPWDQVHHATVIWGLMWTHRLTILPRVTWPCQGHFGQRVWCAGSELNDRHEVTDFHPNITLWGGGYHYLHAWTPIAQLPAFLLCQGHGTWGPGTHDLTAGPHSGSQGCLSTNCISVLSRNLDQDVKVLLIFKFFFFFLTSTKV